MSERYRVQFVTPMDSSTLKVPPPAVPSSIGRLALSCSHLTALARSVGASTPATPFYQVSSPGTGCSTKPRSSRWCCWKKY
ncbi:hypothetical protein T492DRAFT_1035738 [Pavlovales sp. CCMP2436]|nr:hypothetical protein T492DRAFT_1035738 [Pavlovales sp. CCMP2436]